jgi:GH18 family chitinase
MRIKYQNGCYKDAFKNVKQAQLAQYLDYVNIMQSILVPEMQDIY